MCVCRPHLKWKFVGFQNGQKHWKNFEERTNESITNLNNYEVFRNDIQWWMWKPCIYGPSIMSAVYGLCQEDHLYSHRDVFLSVCLNWCLRFSIHQMKRLQIQSVNNFGNSFEVFDWKSFWCNFLQKKPLVIRPINTFQSFHSISVNDLLMNLAFC